MFGLLKGQCGRLQNFDQGGGFRDERAANRSLINGPDFAGPETQNAVYLPAWQRYKGRFFTSVGEHFWAQLAEHPVEVLFVSGLYGLLFWDERIQDYDCHLGDEARRQSLSSTVADVWRPLLTDVLCEFIEQRRREGAPIDHVFDLLSEELYQTVFEWDQLCSSSRVEIHHRNFDPPRIGAESLTWIAQIVTDNLPRFYQKECPFKNGEWYPLTIGQRFRFKYPRVTERDDVFELLCLSCPALRKLPREVCGQLIKAEMSGRAVTTVREIDCIPLVLSYVNCVELWLNSVGPPELRGNPVKIVRTIPELSRIEQAFGRLWHLRNAAAHPEELRRMKALGWAPAGLLGEARRLAIKILCAAAEIRITASC